MEAFLSGILDMEMVFVDSDFVNGIDGLNSVLIAVVVLPIVSVRLCLLMLRRLRLGGSDSRVFVVMILELS